jgi:hypothetical protein
MRRNADTLSTEAGGDTVAFGVEECAYRFSPSAT